MCEVIGVEGWALQAAVNRGLILDHGQDQSSEQDSW